MLDFVDFLAAVRIDDIAEPVLVLVAFLGDQTAFKKFGVRS